MGAAMGEKAMVVTSDRDIVASVEHRGCTVISALAFEEKLQLAVLMAGGDDGATTASEGWTPTTRKKGPRRRLPKKQRRMRRKQKKL
jgi:hypothetical protein